MIGPEPPARAGDDLVLSVVSGSRAYGLETAESDTDRRGVSVAPTEAFWRLDKPPAHREGPLPEQFSWEVERFCVLVLQANPTVLECLWSPLVEAATPTGRRLLELRGAFLSRRAHETFARYADVRVTGERERLLAVRRGEVPWAEVDAWRGRLAAELAAAESVRPDREAVEEFLIGVRRENL